jgi:glycosyltransferase involved in cell wall biosynthesis
MAVSHPYQNGYCSRGRYMIASQQSLGYLPFVVTSPFYPGTQAAIDDEVIDGVPHYRIPHPVDLAEMRLDERVVAHLHCLRIRGKSFITSRFNVAHQPGTGDRQEQDPTQVEPNGQVGLRSEISGHSKVRDAVKNGLRGLNWLMHSVQQPTLMRRFARELGRIVDSVQPQVLHAHSPYWCADAALRVGRARGLPVVYEVRGLWEDSTAAEGIISENSRAYRAWRTRELCMLHEADAVICICERLRDDLESRGINPQKVFVVPNAVDAHAFQPIESTLPVTAPDAAQSVRNRLRGMVIGYVGSIRKLEGVDETVRGVAAMLRQNIDVSLLIVGDGSGLDQLKRLAVDEGLGDRAVFTGRIPHEQVRHYYAMLDVFVVSRPPLRVTNLVTPLKPLEAMAMGKPLLVSDLPALREIVRHDETGLTYRPGDLVDFVHQCRRYADDRDLRRRVTETAREWVQEHRNWTTVLGPMREAYALACANSASR